MAKRGPNTTCLRPRAALHEKTVANACTIACSASGSTAFPLPSRSMCATGYVCWINRSAARPASASAAVEADAGLAALRLIQQTYPVAHIDRDGNGKAVLPDAEQAMVHAFATVFSWSAARGRKHVVFGPRFAIYPAVV